ncbi:unnamed protein product [Owenia fusiformis]|nr:unnamed protein product [Owenia fusiformis]
MIFGMGLLYSAMFSSNQHFVQRYLTLNTNRKAQGSLYINVVIAWIVISMCCLVGVVMFASYASCDPMKLGHVDIPDKMIGHFVMDLFGSLKGMPGLFIVTVTAAAMSTMSSGQNALAAVYLEDVTKPIYTAVHKTPMTEAFATNITKCFGVFFGLATIAVTFILAEAKDTLLIIFWKLFGILGGPLFGMFTIGILCPCANAWGAAAGLVSSLGILIWINAGVLMFKIRPNNLPTDISGCIVNASEYYNKTTASEFLDIVTSGYLNLTQTGHPFELNTSFSSVTDGVLTLDVELSKESGIFYLYNVSYVWYTLIALIVTFAVGLPVSLLAACVTGKYKAEDLDERLFWSVFKQLSGCCRSKKSTTKNGSVSTTVFVENQTFDNGENQYRKTQNTQGIANKGFFDSNRL